MTTAYDPAAVCQAVNLALGCADDVWYRDIIKKDICGCELSADEERAVLDGAVGTAARLAQRITARYGSSSPQELLQVMNLKLRHTREELREPFLYLGLYEPGTRTITLNDSTLSQIQQFIEINRLADLTPAEALTNIAVYHEIFHALEEEIPDIYTRSRMLTRKVLGIFPRKRGLDGASEVGAVHFSRCMTGITCSPCIYERYLLVSLNLLSIDFLPPNV